MAESNLENSGALNQQPKFEIPNLSPKEGQESEAERAIEKRQISENTAAKAAPQFPVVQQAQQLPQQTAQDPAASKSTASPLTSNLQAHDADLIEKEWVQRAKHLVAQTQDDPFKQNNEMSRMKADYIKKRFNKTIPVDDNKK